MLRLDNVKVYKDLDEAEVIRRTFIKNWVDEEDVITANIVKKSIDARDKKNVHYTYAIEFDVKDESKYPKIKHVEYKAEPPLNKRRKSTYKPIIIGAGPAGLFCALTLVENGYEPVIIEQGSKVDERIKYVEEYKTTGQLNEMCNVQFGEGGAGTFSDGKLTTSINSPYIKKVLHYFHEFGAPKEILYVNKPHIGTDNLVEILKNIRSYIESKGGKYYFNNKVVDIQKGEKLIKVCCRKNDFFTDTVVLAIGHSARDTYKMLLSNGMDIVRKNFSVGVRIEHKQKMINETQYGTITTLQLRSCYTFCMCPGGEVIASASHNGEVVTNGMSTFKRDKENANGALLVNVLTTDFPGTDPLAGMYFQEDLEHKAYELGGSNGYAPVQRVEDFLKNKPSTKIGEIIPSYKPGYKLCNLNEILPDFVSKTLKEGIVAFDKKLTGFAHPDAILTGVETRSSSPVTIKRDEDLMSNLEGIYPCGEGAGYAGGITSAAVDGIKVAIKIIEKE